MAEYPKTMQLAYLPNETVSVERFGAKGDGVTDDTAALNAFAAALVDGQTVLIPDGTYLYDPTSSPLTFAANNITITGRGVIKAVNSTDLTVVVLSGNGIVWDGPSVEGEGTVYSSYTTSTEANRYALLRVTGDDVEIRKALINNPYLVGLHGNACDNLKIGSGVDVLGGPVAAAVSTYFQAIRLYTCTNYEINNPHIGENAAGGKPEEGVLATSGTNGYIRVRATAAWDHGVYAIAEDGVIIDGCLTVSNAAGIACSPPEYQTTKVTPTKITNNNVRASATPTGTVGLYARDMHNAVIANNFVQGFPRSYQIAPVQYDDVNNHIEGIVFSGNIARNWNEFGLNLALAGASLGKYVDVKIIGFDSMPARTTMAAGSAHIYGVISAGIASDFIISSCTLASNGSDYPERGMYFQNVDNLNIVDNVIKDCSSVGIYLSNCDGAKVKNNRLSDAGTTGIDVAGSCANGSVTGNDIIDGSLHNLTYGIDGNNNCTGFLFADNRIKGSSSAGIRRCQFGGNTNTFYGNKTGDDSLQGVVTLAAATTTTVTNDNINVGVGYTSYVKLTPTNQAAATLVSGANSPYVGSGDHVSGVSFKVRQAGTPTGTETFFYEIIQ